MNKKCTNSSCRRTFSTLNFSGFCPHCGKLYLQLLKPHPRILCLTDGSAGSRLNVFIGETCKLIRKGTRIQAVKSLRATLNSRGFCMSLRDSVNIVDAIKAHNAPRFICRITKEVQNDFKVVKLEK